MQFEEGDALSIGVQDAHAIQLCCCKRSAQTLSRSRSREADTRPVAAPSPPGGGAWNRPGPALRDTSHKARHGGQAPADCPHAGGAGCSASSKGQTGCWRGRRHQRGVGLARVEGVHLPLRSGDHRHQPVDPFCVVGLDAVEPRVGEPRQCISSNA